MNIYQIDEAIEAILAGSVDEETGEVIVDMEALDALMVEREKKIENVALYIKNCEALAKSIREEEKVLADRRRSAERKAERLMAYLDGALAGEKFSTPRVACTYRASSVVEVDDEFLEWAYKKRPDLIRMKPPEADKAAIKKLLKGGEEIPHTTLVEKQSLSIK